MTFTKNNKELWVGSGNVIVIIQPDTFEIIKRIKALKSPRALISSMVSDGIYVWTTDRKTSVVIQWNIETREHVFKFQCNVENPLNRNLILKDEMQKSNQFPIEDTESAVATSDLDVGFKNHVPTSSNSLQEEMNITQPPLPNLAPSLVSSSEKASASSSPDSKSPRAQTLSGMFNTLKGGNKLTRVSSSSLIEDMQSVGRKPPVDGTGKPRSNSENAPCTSSIENRHTTCVEKEVISSSSLMQKLSLRKQPSLMFTKRSVKKKGVEKAVNNKTDTQHVGKSNQSAILRPRSSALSGSLNNRATSIVYVGGTLWVGRACGDILVINVSENKNIEGESNFCCDFGTVIAQLGHDIRNQVSFSRTVTSVVPLTPEQVVAVIRTEPRLERLPSSRSSVRSRKVSPSTQSHIFDSFQLFLFDGWSTQQYEKFNKYVLIKNSEDVEE